MKHLFASLTLACTLPFAALGQDSALGGQLYQRHCATCHGPEARGDGPMRPALLI